MASVVSLPNVSMIFLVAVLFAAVRFGIWPAVVSSILSFLGYNFFFIDPVYTFTVARPHELLALFIFLGAAVLTSALAGRAREQAAAASAGRGRRGVSTSSPAGSPASPMRTRSPKAPPGAQRLSQPARGDPPAPRRHR